MKASRWFWVWMLVLFVFGCKEKEPLTYYVNQEMLPYCWFPTGSYWIYQEEGTPGLTDSVYITNTWTEILPEEGEGFQSERYGNGIMIQGKLFGQTRTAWPSAAGENLSVTMMIEGHNGGSEIISDPVFFWDTDGSSVLSYYPDISAVHQDSLTFWGNTYHDLIVVTRTPPQAADRTFETIWARGVGVIRRSMVDGTSWSLLRYHINP